MPVFSEYDRQFVPVRIKSDFGEQRFSSFEPAREAWIMIAIGIGLLAIAAGVILYGMQDHSREMMVLGGAFFAWLFSILLLLGLVRLFRSRKQIHLFDHGIVQTTAGGKVVASLAYEEVADCRVKHSHQPGANQIDRYTCTVIGKGITIKFSDYARRYQADRSNKLTGFVRHLQRGVERSKAKS